MAYSSAVKLTGVSKRYSDVTAVDYLDLVVNRREIFGLGSNGSRKSKALKMILELVKTGSGSANILDINIKDDLVE